MSKQISTRTQVFARGGSGHMVGKQQVGKQKPGITSTEGTSVGVAKGGSGHMVGKQKVKPAKKQ